MKARFCEVRIMYKFENITEKESFENTIDFQCLKIKSIKALHENQKQWNITDRFGNEWNVAVSYTHLDVYKRQM